MPQSSHTMETDKRSGKKSSHHRRDEEAADSEIKDIIEKGPS